MKRSHGHDVSSNTHLKQNSCNCWQCGAYSETTNKIEPVIDSMWCPGPGLHSGVWGIAPVLFPACQKRWLEGGCGRLWWRCLKVTYCYSPGLNLQQVWRKGAAGYCKHETVGSVLWTTSYSSSLGMDEEEEIIVTTGWRRSGEKCSFTEATNTFFWELSTGWTVWSVTMVLFMYLLFFFSFHVWRSAVVYGVWICAVPEESWCQGSIKESAELTTGWASLRAENVNQN